MPPPPFKQHKVLHFKLQLKRMRALARDTEKIDTYAETSQHKWHFC